MDWKNRFKGKKILVAEDDIESQELMKDILLQMSCLVEIAANGNEAATMAIKDDYDLIFMDIRMPNKDGIEAIKEIRLAQKRHIPIIALTASVIENRELILQSGADDLIHKPINLEEMRNKMAERLEAS